MITEITKLILSLSDSPLTRVRLAKTIYFTHKELIRKKLMHPEDIAYLRLPLGPAPVGLPEAILSNASIIISDLPSHLIYENKAYDILSNDDETLIEALIDALEGTLGENAQKTAPEIVDTARKTLKTLGRYRTPMLVRASYDPSWRAHVNGEKYYLTPADLKNTFPNLQLRLRLPVKSRLNDAGALQASLLRGMLTDIVQESTDLEYPDSPAPKPKTPKRTGLPPTSIIKNLKSKAHGA